MSVENKKNLVSWSSSFNELIRTWLKNNNPDILDNFENLEFLEKTVFHHMGYNPIFPVTGLYDRKHEKQFMYNVKPPLEWIPFEEQPTRSFTDCMFDAAQSIADEGKTIDLFWSGGLDSSAMLIAFNELGLHKQLRIIMGGETETPNLFDKLIKGRIDYVIDETNTLNNTYSIAKPDEHIWTAGAEADIMFGAKANLYGRGINTENNIERWNFKRQYYYTRRLFRMITYCNIDWVDVNNHKSFYTHPSIEKYVINHVLSGEMVFYDLTKAGWDYSNKSGIVQWLKTEGLGDKHSKNQEHYLTCKMPIRDFIYNFTKDKNTSYKMTKIPSEIKLRFQKSSDPAVTYVKKPIPPPRNIAVTGEGVVITKDNFLDYDWSDYINT